MSKYEELINKNFEELNNLLKNMPECEHCGNVTEYKTKNLFLEEYDNLSFHIIRRCGVCGIADKLLEIEISREEIYRAELLKVYFERLKMIDYYFHEKGKYSYLYDIAEDRRKIIDIGEKGLLPYFLEILGIEKEVEK